MSSRTRLVLPCADANMADGGKPSAPTMAVLSPSAPSSQSKYHETQEGSLKETSANFPRTLMSTDKLKVCGQLSVLLFSGFVPATSRAALSKQESAPI